jgi:hypothetical protein
MALVVLDELECLHLCWTAETEHQVDPLEHRRVAAVADGFEADVDLVEPNPGITGTTLDQQDPAGRHPRQEGIGRRDLHAGPAEMRGLIDHELVVTHLVDGAARCGCAGGVDPIDDELVAGHQVSMTVRAIPASLGRR